MLNGFIHTIMYTYYFVSLHTKEIWWKSALTLSQMIQFVVMNAQAGYLLYYSCNLYPKRIITAYLYYIVSLLILFANFFNFDIISNLSDSLKKCILNGF
jgi:elongation of very long chain fatty acids protein 4